MNVNIVTNTNGKGLWTDEVRKVIINRVDIGYSSLKYYPDEPFQGELRAYFEPHGFTVGSWNVEGHGLIFTDKQWMKEFKAGLRALGLSIKAVQNVKYGEKEMQGDNYVSMDIGPRFWASWKRLAKQMEAKNVVA